ncbi:MAG: DUF4145 domain-containing protein [Acidobacteriia bacterium]|nr:DUF4145 domain-containing protein [Terriglobia bacterium]
MERPENLSKRSAILGKVLKFINAEEWRDYGDYMVFGLAMLDESSHSVLVHDLPSDFLERYRQFLEFDHAFNAYVDQKISTERTTLKARPSDSEFLKRLRALPERLLRLQAQALDLEVPPTAEFTPEEFLRQLKEQLALKDEREARSHSSVPAEHDIDGLDSHYCEEVLDTLELIVSRASALEAVRTESIPNTKVRRCFEEAMRCYLYGFNMACAAMCRALLEAALKEVIDPDGRLRPVKDAKGRGASYFLTLVDNARWSGKLSNELTGSAKQVKEAGDAAVHDAAKFAIEYPAKKVESLLDRTRQILSELYGHSS